MIPSGISDTWRVRPDRRARRGPRATYRRYSGGRLVPRRAGRRRRDLRGLATPPDEGRVPPSVRQELVTLAESPPILRSMLLVNGRLDAELKQAIKQILLQASDDEEGKAALKAYYKVKKYTELEGESLANLNRMRQLYGRLNGIF